MEVPGKSRNKDLEEVDAVLCQPCQERNQSTRSNGFCAQCQEHMCVTCFDTHKQFKLNRGHSLVDGNDAIVTVEQNDDLQKCDEHFNELVKFYCPMHKQVGCGDCMILEHKVCKVEYIRNKARKFADSLEFKGLVNDADKCLIQCKETATSIKNNKVQVSDISEKFIKDVEMFSESLISHINKMKTSMIKQASMEKLEKENEVLMEDISSLAELLKSQTEQPSKLFVSYVIKKPRLKQLVETHSKIEKQNSLKNYQFNRNGNLEQAVKETRELGSLQEIKLENYETGEEKGGTYTTKLKDIPSTPKSSLKRSSSSPNIAKLFENEPKISDRKAPSSVERELNQSKGEEKGGTYTTKLKDIPSTPKSSLKRSSSSPNIAKLFENEPKISDRKAPSSVERELNQSKGEEKRSPYTTKLKDKPSTPKSSLKRSSSIPNIAQLFENEPKISDRKAPSSVERELNQSKGGLFTATQKRRMERQKQRMERQKELIERDVQGAHISPSLSVDRHDIRLPPPLYQRMLLTSRRPERPLMQTRNQRLDSYKLLCRNVKVDGEYLSYVDNGKGDVGLFVFQNTRDLEIEIIDKGQRGTIAVGGVPKNYPENCQPGWKDGSIGYHADNGNLYHGGGFGKTFGPKCGDGDRMGIKLMIDLLGNCVVFSRNSERVGSVWCDSSKMFPAIGFHSPGEVVKVIMGDLRN